MKKLYLLVFVLLSFHYKALEANSDTLSVPFFGFGLHIGSIHTSDLWDSQYEPVNTLILDFSPTRWLRIEPEFGFKQASAAFNGYNYNLGVGLLFMKKLKSLNLFTGLRYSHINAEINSGAYYGNRYLKSTKQVFGTVLGGEYFFGSNFAIGGEIGLKVAGMTAEESSKFEYGYFYTDSGIFMKFYF